MNLNSRSDCAHRAFGPRWRMGLAGMLGGLLFSSANVWAASADALLPKSLRAQVVALAEDAETGRTAVITRNGEVWTGNGSRLKERPELRLDPWARDVILDGDTIIVWSTRRTGLSARTKVVAEIRGSIVQTVVDSPILDVRIADSSVVFLLPGELLVLSPAAPPLLRPLPVERPEFSGDGLGIRGRGWSGGAVDPHTGCVTSDAPSAASRWASHQWNLHQSACQQTAYTDDAPVLTEVETLFRAQRAAMSGDIVRTTAYGYRGANVEALRPRVEHKPGVLYFGGLGQVNISKALVDVGPVAIVYDMVPDTHPGLLIGGQDGAACQGSVVWVEQDENRRTWLLSELDRLHQANVSCASNLHIVPPNAAPPREDNAGVRYLDKSGTELGWRSGVASPGFIRDDLAWLGEDDEMKQLIIQAKPLSPEWFIGPGPVTVMTKDVDGSWLAGVGWEIARATADGYRMVRMALPGAATSIAVAPDGRYDVLAGGQRVQVLFEGGTLGNTTPPAEWSDTWTLDPAEAPAKPTFAWPATPSGVRVPGGPAVETGGTPLEVVAWPYGAIVRTRAGLVALWPDGSYAWRIPDATHMMFVEDLILVGSRFGLSAFRPPTTKPPAPLPDKPSTDSETEAANGQGGPKGGQGGPKGGQGGPRGGGQGGPGGGQGGPGGGQGGPGGGQGGPGGGQGGPGGGQGGPGGGQGGPGGGQGGPGGGQR